MDTNHIKFLCLESCLRYCPMVTGFSGWAGRALTTLRRMKRTGGWDKEGKQRSPNISHLKVLRKILTLWASEPHPVWGGLPFGSDAVANETLKKSPGWKKLPGTHRRDGRSRSPPCPRRSRTETQRRSPKRWTRSSGSWGVCDRGPTRRGQPAARCGAGPPEWGSHRTDTGTARTAAPVWPTTPRRPGRTERREGRSWRGPSGASAPPLESWSEGRTWAEKVLKLILVIILWMSWPRVKTQGSLTHSCTCRTPSNTQILELKGGLMQVQCWYRII